ncbi:MAG: pyridoxamine 5'-phosphate oxidase family protein [Anaerolineae bacterium]|nr:pyridoxamine 5'-phosphate oxidase family protein [Anaerolineae bacterium]
MPTIPDSFRDLLLPQTRAFVVLHTQSADGDPLMTPMWFSMDGDILLLNSTPATRKHKNMLANPHIRCLIFDPGNMYRYLDITGTVIDISQEGANAHNQLLAEKYDWDDGTFGDNRVIYRIRIDRAKGIA